MWYRQAKKAKAKKGEGKILGDLAEVCFGLSSKLMPGYGDCQWNPETKAVYWNMGDGDTWPDGVVRERFLAVPGVEGIEFGDEGPHDLGSPWVTVDWRGKDTVEDRCQACGKPSGRWQEFCRPCLADKDVRELDELGVCPACGVKYSDDCTHCERCGYEPGDTRPPYKGT